MAGAVRKRFEPQQQPTGFRWAAVGLAFGVLFGEVFLAVIIVAIMAPKVM